MTARFLSNSTEKRAVIDRPTEEILLFFWPVPTRQIIHQKVDVSRRHASIETIHSHDDVEPLFLRRLCRADQTGVVTGGANAFDVPLRYLLLRTILFCRRSRTFGTEVLRQILGCNIDLFVVQLSTVSHHLDDQLFPRTLALLQADHRFQAVTGGAPLFEELLTIAFGQLLRHGHRQSRECNSQDNPERCSSEHEAQYTFSKNA